MKHRGGGVSPTGGGGTRGGGEKIDAHSTFTGDQEEEVHFTILLYKKPQSMHPTGRGTAQKKSIRGKRDGQKSCSFPE